MSKGQAKHEPVKITVDFLNKVKPPVEGYEYWWDRTCKGYGVRIAPTGKKMFVAQGRVRGKPVIFSLGPNGTVTEEKARKKAQKVLQDMRDGIDPRDARKADEAMQVTLQQVCDCFVERPGKLKKTTRDEYKRHVEKVFTAWKDKPIVSITEDDVRKRHRELMDKGLTGKAAPASANAAMVTLRILMNFAARQYRLADGSPLIQRNPVNVLRDHWAKLGNRTERYIDRRKVGEVWNKLHAMRSEAVGYEALAAVDLTIFAVLVGARRDEMATLTWDRVNIDDDDPTNCWWRLEDRKQGDPIQLPLSSQAVALLKSRPRLKLADDKESPFVFPSWGKSGRIMDARTPMEAVSKIAGMHLSLHDMRRTFTNIAMRECRIGKFETDMLTGHKPAQEDVTARNYLNLTRLHEWLTEEVQKIGDWIEQQGLISASENVVALAA